MVKAIVGANWGDEGKGKITDMMAGEADVVVRYQGGANAGHTIVNQYGKFALHTLPSGIFHPEITNVIASGVALDIPVFFKELQGVVEKGVPMPRILISDRVQIMMPYHKQLDALEEARLAGASFGSTKSGIAPFYSDKYAKIGWQINELFGTEEEIRAKIKRVAPIKDVMLVNLYGQPPLDQDALYEELIRWRDMVKDYVGNVSAFMDKAIREGKTILLEGQLGTMKDTDNGIYPMVTSSPTLAGYGTVSAGIPPYAIQQIVAVTKAYSSAVGAGAFVSEIFGEAADAMREHGGDGGEYGATTGRPRRMGWYDCVASRYGCRLQGATDVVLTVLDALGYLDEIPVCTAYEIDGKIVDEFPVTSELEKAKPVLTVLPGWKKDIRGIRTFEELPKEAQDYVNFIEAQLGYPITMVSNGPGREDIIRRTSRL